MFQKIVDNYSRVQIFVMTSVTTARGEQNTHKTLTIIILLRSVYVLMFYLPTFLFILHPSSLRHVTKVLRYHH